MEYIIIAYFWFNSLFVAYTCKDLLEEFEYGAVGYIAPTILLVIGFPILFFIFIYLFCKKLYIHSHLNFYIDFWRGEYSNLSPESLEFLNRHDFQNKTAIKRRNKINRNNGYKRK